MADMELCLVGRVLSRKEIHIESFERTIVGGLEIAEGVHVQKLGEDRLLFQFNHVVDKKHTLWRSPYAFDRNLVILRPIEKHEDPLAVNLEVCEFHVQVSGLPISGNHRGLAEIIGNALGLFVEYDAEVNQGRIATRMRIQVLIDVTKPLRRSMNIAGPNGQSIQVQFIYEKLPNFCYFVGRWVILLRIVMLVWVILVKKMRLIHPC